MFKVPAGLRRTCVAAPSFLLVICTIVVAGACSKSEEGKPLTAAPNRTELIVFDPFDDGGVKPDITVTGRATGDCQASNLVSRNTDARRCFTDTSEVLDPCYVSPAQRPGVAVCISDPTTAEATELSVASDAGPPVEQNGFAGDPWFIELETGQTCQLLGGATTELHGLRLNFACDDEVYLYGSPDRSQPVWRIRRQDPGDPELRMVPMRKAWY